MPANNLPCNASFVCSRTDDFLRGTSVILGTRTSSNSAEMASVPALGETTPTSEFPTLAETERTLLLAAYRRSNRRPFLAARLLGIGKATMYRKLREMKNAGLAGVPG